LNIALGCLANCEFTRGGHHGDETFGRQSGGLKTLTIGFPTPLLYKRGLRLSVTVNEPNVAQILANVVHGGT
jgi:hypothetical protein